MEKRERMERRRGREEGGGERKLSEQTEGKHWGRLCKEEDKETPRRRSEEHLRETERRRRRRRQNDIVLCFGRFRILLVRERIPEWPTVMRCVSARLSIASAGSQTCQRDSSLKVVPRLRRR